MKGARPYTRHGLTAPLARVKLQGLSAIDRRSAGYRAMDAWRSALVTDLGGEAALSAQRRALVDQVVRSRLMLEAIDAYLLSQRAIVRGRPRGTALPIMRERQDLADSIARILGQLGLDRVARPAPSLAETWGKGKA
jgi:hypothetical protein